MNSHASASGSLSFHALIANVSGLFGVVVFLQQILRGASLDHVLFTAATAGLMVYLILAVGYAAARRLIADLPSSENPDDSSDASSEQAAAEQETEDAQNVSEPQAA